MAGSKILCIDDEEMGLLVRKLILESEGFEVAIAADGKSGLQLFNNERFDLVLLDHSMRRYIAGRRLKAPPLIDMLHGPATSQTPIIGSPAYSP